MASLSQKSALKRFLDSKGKDNAAKARLKSAFPPTKSEIKKTVTPLKEDGGGAPANSAGSGAVAGIGVGKQGEPGVNQKANNSPVLATIRRAPPVNENHETFAGHRVFLVNNDKYHECRLGKRKYLRYDKYVGNDELGEEIRQYGRANPKHPIIVKHKDNGSMMWLRYGGKTHNEQQYNR